MVRPIADDLCCSITPWQSGTNAAGFPDLVGRSSVVMTTGSIQVPFRKMRANPGERMQRKNNNGLPAYQRIQTGIRLRIESGQLRPGDAVDSERNLAKIHQA